ncbi:MAG: hypothetical protein H6648_07705 [Caldilineae bacterium]|nr:hypothetical protein [Caldilineae bacterium]
MSKTLDESAVANELKGSSGFFRPHTDRSKQTPGSKKPSRDFSDRSVRGNRGVTTPAQAERSNRTPEPNGQPERSSVLDELRNGVVEQPLRATERYSFEIYTDQKQQIQNAIARYQLKTGRRLSASRLIREALDALLYQLSDRS